MVKQNKIHGDHRGQVLAQVQDRFKKSTETLHPPTELSVAVKDDSGSLPHFSVRLYGTENNNISLIDVFFYQLRREFTDLTSSMVLRKKIAEYIEADLKGKSSNSQFHDLIITTITTDPMLSTSRNDNIAYMLYNFELFISCLRLGIINGGSEVMLAVHIMYKRSILVFYENQIPLFPLGFNPVYEHTLCLFLRKIPKKQSFIDKIKKEEISYESINYNIAISLM